MNLSLCTGGARSYWKTILHYAGFKRELFLFSWTTLDCCLGPAWTLDMSENVSVLVCIFPNRFPSSSSSFLIPHVHTIMWFASRYGCYFFGEKQGNRQLRREVRRRRSSLYYATQHLSTFQPYLEQKRESLRCHHHHCCCCRWSHYIWDQNQRHSRYKSKLYKTLHM